ncbi:MAG TPA: hypothetical protein VKM56_05190, partial [Verrucomicrobiae bacterium]|nr:hypothetical protein [Verrucomicrobiae bacterium]
FWPRFAVAGAAMVLLSLVLVNINQHPNSGEAGKVATARKDLLEEREQRGRSIDDRASRPPANGPAADYFFEDRDRSSGAKNSKDARLQRELKLAENERVPAQTERDTFAGASTKKALDPAPTLRMKRGELKGEDELTVARESLDRKRAPAPEFRVSLADGLAKADADQDTQVRREAGATSASSGSRLHPEASPKPDLTRSLPPVAQSETRQLPGQTLGDQPQPLGRSDASVKGGLSADGSGTRQAFYAIAPSTLGAESNAVAFTHPTLTVMPNTGPALAYDSTKEASFFKRSRLEVENRPVPSAVPVPPISSTQPAESSLALIVASPAPAEPVWNFGYAGNAGAAPAITARFANINQKVQSAAEDKKQPAPKSNEAWGEAAHAQPLSTTFNVEQNGDSIRIVDFDGSIYTGRLLQRANALDAEKTKAERSVDAVNELQQTSQSAADGSEVPFRASGTNRTLNKLVVVDGAMFGHDAAQLDGAASKERGYRGLAEQPLIDFKGALQAAKPAAASKLNEPTNQPLPEILRASSIKGTVRLDVTNELKIEAKRVSQ